MSKIKVMVTLLTSGQKYWFNECWKSIKNQFPVNTIDYDVYFVVNTLNDGYWDAIKRWLFSSYRPGERYDCPK